MRIRPIRMLSLALVVMVAIATPSKAQATTELPIVVSMGDSYSSGEGVDPFYGQSGRQKFWNQDWLAHRSKESWPGKLLFDGTPLRDYRAVPSSKGIWKGKNELLFSYDDWSEGTWFFVASSGATTNNIIGDREGGRQKKEVLTAWNPLSIEEQVDYTARLARQLDVFDYIDSEYGHGAVDFVTISIGGNDLGFADIVKEAAASTGIFDPSYMERRIDEAKKKFIDDKVRQRISDTYEAIIAAAGDQAEVIVVGYPRLFNGEASSAAFIKRERDYIDKAAEWLDEELYNLVNKLNKKGHTNLHYVSAMYAFQGHGAYTSDAYIRKVTIPHTDQDLVQAGLDGALSPYSMHPNSKGTRAYAAAVQEELDNIVERKRDVADENRPETLFQSDEDKVVMSAYREFLLSKLGECNATNGGLPAITVGELHGFKALQTYYFFAVGKFYLWGPPVLLLCSELDPGDGTASMSTHALFSYDREEREVVLLNQGFSMDRIDSAMFYSGPFLGSGASGCVRLELPNNSNSMIGQWSSFLFAHPEDYPFDEALKDRIVRIGENGEDVYAWSLGGFDLYQVESKGSDINEPISEENADLLRYSGYVPSTTLGFEFNHENIESLV